MQSQTIDQSREMEEKNWWDLWNTSYRAQDSVDPTSTELFAHVADLIQKISSGSKPRLLEVACGTGTLSRTLGFSTYHGLDLSAAAVEIARQKAALLPLPEGAAPATYEAADFLDWPLPKEPFDVVLFVDAIACIRDQQVVLEKIARSLDVNGHLVLTTVNPFVYNRIRRAGGVRLENGPVSHYLKRSELHALVKRAGLKMERSFSIMPRGNMGILRFVNARRLNDLCGVRGADILRRLKEMAGLGQYNVVVARKSGSSRH